MSRLPDTARASCAQHDLLPNAAAVVVLVSGGADSTALLRLLAAGELGPGLDLTVLHVNHGLRGAAADADEAFVAALASDLGVPIRSVRVDVSAWASGEGLNLEDAGRRVRYRLADEVLDARLAALGRPVASGRIATAHTLDDRIETFFMRALTGAGAGALSGIPYRRGRVVRPLLDAERAEVRAFLNDLGQSWREDESNQDTARLRSAVRHELLPAAERVTPGFRSVMRRTLGLLSDDDELLSELADAFVRDFAEAVPESRIEFDREAMLTLSHAMMRRAVRQGILATFPAASRLDAEHVEAIVNGLHDPAFARDLPFGLRARSQYARLVVSRAVDVPPAVAPSLLSVPGKADLGDAGWIRAEDADTHDLSGGADSVVIDADGVDALVIDSVRPGDRMQPLGMDGTRKLSDMLVDAKVPREMRQATPVVRHEGRVVWLAGVRLSDEFRVGPDTARAVRLSWDRPRGCEPGTGKDEASA